MHKESDEKIRCEKCGSTMVYIRLSTNERVCRTCGNVESLNHKEKSK